MGNDGQSDLRGRTKKFALAVIGFCESLPRSGARGVIGRQLLRSGTSVGANYRACCQARSKAEFIAKMGVVAEEADECEFWMELLIESGLCKNELVASLMREAHELASIAVASLNTARRTR